MECTKEAEVPKEAEIWLINNLGWDMRHVESPTLWIDIVATSCDKALIVGRHFSAKDIIDNALRKVILTDLKGLLDDNRKNSRSDNSDENCAFNLTNHENDDCDQSESEDDDWPSNEIAVIAQGNWYWALTCASHETCIDQTDQGNK